MALMTGAKSYHKSKGPSQIDVLTQNNSKESSQTEVINELII